MHHFTNLVLVLLTFFSLTFADTLLGSPFTHATSLPTSAGESWDYVNYPHRWAPTRTLSSDPTETAHPYLHPTDTFIKSHIHHDFTAPHPDSNTHIGYLTHGAPAEHTQVADGSDTSPHVANYVADSSPIIDSSAAAHAALEARQGGWACFGASCEFIGAGEQLKARTRGCLLLGIASVVLIAGFV